MLSAHWGVLERLLRWCPRHDSYHLAGHWPANLRHR